MKAITFLLLLILTISFQINSKAQATAYANIYATVVAPVGMTMEMDLRAGKIINTNQLSSSSLSTQTINAAENINLTQDGQTTIAAFQVTGKNNVYAVTVQNQPVVLLNENANSVTVDNFGSELAMINNATEGVQQLRISANLNVSKDQPKGIYGASAPFNVTLNYN